MAWGRGSKAVPYSIVGIKRTGSEGCIEVLSVALGIARGAFGMNAERLRKCKAHNWVKGRIGVELRVGDI